MGRTSRGAVASVYALLVLGVSAVSVAVLPGVSVFRHATVVDVVTGEPLFDLTSLVVSGGCLLIGVGAILIGSLLMGVERYR